MTTPFFTIATPTPSASPSNGTHPERTRAHGTPTEGTLTEGTHPGGTVGEGTVGHGTHPAGTVGEGTHPSGTVGDGSVTEGSLIPGEHARSWWTPTMLHGRLLAGLLARALEREHGATGFRFSRLTVDMFRNAPFGPVTIRTERLRDGHRIRVAEATVLGSTGPVARASAVLLREGTQPAGRVPSTPPWDAPHPDTLPPPERDRSPHTWRFDRHNRPLRHWPGEGGRRIWLREVTELVAGEPNSPLVRAALAADAASPLAHAADTELEFINADYTLYLSRVPVGDTIGLESDGHTSSDGIAVGACTVHDVAGPLGYCTTAAIANPGVRRHSRPKPHPGEGRTIDSIGERRCGTGPNG